MNGKDFRPLPVACVKNLCDKVFDKRKTGALEVEQIVNTLIVKNKFDDVEKLLIYFGDDFLKSCNLNHRKGGLMGLAAVAFALGQASANYVDRLLQPLFPAFRDDDGTVRNSSCEAAFNIIKVLQKATLKYLNDLFEAFSILTADKENITRTAAEQCDRLLRDIVTQSLLIDLPSFIPLICERLYTTLPFARKFLVCWISSLSSVPTFNVIVYLPQMLDGLLQILGDSNTQIQRSCELLLKDFLSEIVSKPESVNLRSMMNILINNCCLATKALVAKHQKEMDLVDGITAIEASSELLQQFTTLQWIQKFIEVHSTNQPRLLTPVAPILSSVLPCLGNETFGDNVAVELALRINEQLMKIVQELSSTDLEKSPLSLSNETKESLSYPSSPDHLDTFSILKVIYHLFEHSSVLTRLTALRWVEILVSVQPEAVFSESGELLPLLIKLLSDPAVEVVHSAIALVGCLCKHPVAMSLAASSAAKSSSLQKVITSIMSSSAPSFSSKFSAFSATSLNEMSLDNVVSLALDNDDQASIICLRFLLDVVDQFIEDGDMLTDKGNLIVTDLCLALGAKSVYYVLALIVANLLQPTAAFAIVQRLNHILLTEPNLGEFRDYLRQLNTKKDAELFEQLYRAWCPNPVALLSLCLLTKNYRHSRKLIKSFGELAVSLEVLLEMDQLIQLIESPVFASLRLHLVDRRYSAPLQETLYCLLMCLPQTEAFETLRRRLQCLPSYILDNSERSSPEDPDLVDFDVLLSYFLEVQSRQFQERAKTSMLKTTGSSTNNVVPDNNKNNALESGSRLQLGFMRVSGLPNPAMASSTEFLIKNLEKLGIHAVPPKDSAEDL